MTMAFVRLLRNLTRVDGIGSLLFQLFQMARTLEWIHCLVSWEFIHR